MRQRVSVCPEPSCPNLTPCEVHGRPANASWSPQRDRTSHHKLRAVVVKARGPRCERCGWEALDLRGKGLDLHHVKPGDRPENVTLLCGKQSPNNCHAQVDSKGGR